MKDLGPPSQIEKRAQESIARLKDVVHSRVVAGPDGRIQEIHVLSRSDRSAKQIARDVESCLAASLGISVNHRVISIAQEDPEFDPVEIEVGGELVDDWRPQGSARARLSDDDSERGAEGRLHFERVHMNISGTQTEAQVELRLNGRRGTGRAEGPTTRHNAMRLIAEAALQCIEGFLVGETRFALIDVSAVTLAGRDVVLVAIAHVGSRHEKLLTGSCLVEEDLHQALVFAVLDAVNRTVGRLEPEKRVEYEVGPATAA
jgi:hypothetical protein